MISFKRPVWCAQKMIFGTTGPLCSTAGYVVLHVTFFVPFNSVVRGKVDIKTDGENRVEAGATVKIICSVSRQDYTGPVRPRQNFTKKICFFNSWVAKFCSKPWLFYFYFYFFQSGVRWIRKTGTIYDNLGAYSIRADFDTDSRYSITQSGGSTDGKFAVQLTIRGQNWNKTCLSPFNFFLNHVQTFFSPLPKFAQRNTKEILHTESVRWQQIELFCVCFSTDAQYEDTSQIGCVLAGENDKDKISFVSLAVCGRTHLITSLALSVTRGLPSPRWVWTERIARGHHPCIAQNSDFEICVSASQTTILWCPIDISASFTHTILWWVSFRGRGVLGAWWEQFFPKMENQLQLVCLHERKQKRSFFFHWEDKANLGSTWRQLPLVPTRSSWSFSSKKPRMFPSHWMCESAFQYIFVQHTCSAQVIKRRR